MAFDAPWAFVWKVFVVVLQKMQMSHRPVQWLVVMLILIFTTGQCQQNERWDVFLLKCLNNTAWYKMWRWNFFCSRWCFLMHRNRTTAAISSQNVSPELTEWCGWTWCWCGLKHLSHSLLCVSAVAELWLNTSWCTTAVETSRVSRGSSGCPAPSRVSTLPTHEGTLSTPQRP